MYIHVYSDKQVWHNRVSKHSPEKDEKMEKNKKIRGWIRDNQLSTQYQTRQSATSLLALQTDVVTAYAVA